MKMNTKRMLSILLTLAMLIGIFPAVTLTAGADDGVYVSAETIEAGKTYVLVADGQFALNNQSVDWGSYANSTTNTLGSTPVTIEDGVITSPVTEDMLWTLQPADDAFDGKIYDLPMFYLYDQAGQMLNRRSGSTATAPLQVGGSPSKVPYTTISFYPRSDGTYTAFFNTNQSNDYPFSFNGTENGFNAPGVSQSSWDGETYQSSIQLYEVGSGTVTEVIDFTNPADASKFTVDNQTDSSIIEGEGFYMISTNEAIEDCKGQLSGDAANTPRDTIQVPVSGDWTATLELKVDTTGSNGQYEFLCLYGMADYENGCGIRAGANSTVNFKEVNNVSESSTDGMKVSTGLTSGENHWYRLEKVGTTYTGYLSENGGTSRRSSPTRTPASRRA